MAEALTTVIRMNDKVEEMAGLMKEQQRRLDDLNGRVIRLETMLEIVLNSPGGGSPSLGPALFRTAVQNQDEAKHQ